MRPQLDGPAHTLERDVTLYLICSTEFTVPAVNRNKDREETLRAG